MHDLISRKALLEAMDKEATEMEEAMCIPSWATAKECIRTVKPVDRWIPCSERMPEDGRPVLATLVHTYEHDYRNYGIARYVEFDNGERHWYENHHGYLEWDKYSDGKGGCSLYKVIAWMPLPSPYKAGDIDG